MPNNFVNNNNMPPSPHLIDVSKSGVIYTTHSRYGFTNTNIETVPFEGCYQKYTNSLPLPPPASSSLHSSTSHLEYNRNCINNNENIDTSYPQSNVQNNLMSTSVTTSEHYRGLDNICHLNKEKEDFSANTNTSKNIFQ